MPEFKSKELEEAWKKAWSINSQAKLGEYLGEVKTEFTSYYFWRDAEEEDRYWYDTESNRQFQNMFRNRY